MDNDKDLKEKAKQLIFDDIDSMVCSDRKKRFLKIVNYDAQIELMIKFAKQYKNDSPRFSGLKDCCGIDIYEGHIVSCFASETTMPFCGNTNDKVVYKEYETRDVVIFKDGCFGIIDIEHGFINLSQFNKVCWIEGHINENTELLKP